MDYGLLKSEHAFGPVRVSRDQGEGRRGDLLKCACECACVEIHAWRWARVCVLALTRDMAHQMSCVCLGAVERRTSFEFLFTVLGLWGGQVHSPPNGIESVGVVGRTSGRAGSDDETTRTAATSTSDRPPTPGP